MMKLDFSRVGHCGRQEELDQLLTLCRRRRRRRPRGAPGAGTDLAEVASTSAARAVLIQAESGTGKSELLNALCDELTAPSSSSSKDENSTPSTTITDCYCCRGKFEERAAASEPFAALREAMENILQDLLRQDQEQRRQPQRQRRDTAAKDNAKETHAARLRQALGPDSAILSSVLPSLQSIFSAGTTGTASDSSNNNNNNTAHITLEGSFGNTTQMEWRFERLRFAFRAFVRYASRLQPIVLVLDDVHWADPDSMQIIRTLIQDNASNSTKLQSDFMFVGACRPLERYKHLRQLRNDIPRRTLALMGVSRLSTRDIADICSMLFLEQPPEEPGTASSSEGTATTEVAELAKSLREKTGGNAFVVLQYLRRLEQQELIYYDTDASDVIDGAGARWKWDIAGIQQDVGIHQNVAGVVADSIQGLDECITSALIAAASFGVSHFDLATVVHAVPVVTRGNTMITAEVAPLMEDSSDPFVVRQCMKAFSDKLAKAVEYGFLVEVSAGGHYRFSHDRIREAAYSLLPDGTKGKELHLQIGRQLRSWMEIQGELGTVADFSEEQLLLHAVKQLNEGKELMTDNWEKLDLADLSFQAAELAAQQCSFSSSVEYLEQGIECLPEHAWRDHFDLKLKLSAALMRMQYTLARLDDCLSMATDILNNARDFKDKRAVYHTMLLCMLQQERFGDGIDLAITVLYKELCITTPRRFVLPRAIMGYFQQSRRFSKMSDEEILGIPLTADERIQDACEFFVRILELAFHGAEDLQAYGILLGVKMIELLFEHGASPITFVALLVYAQVGFVLGDFETAHRFHKLGLVFMERGRKQYPDLAARCELIHAISITMGRLPVALSLAPMQKVMTQMWELGALDYVFMNSMDYLRRVFTSGKPLGFVESECQRYSETLSDYNQSLQWLNNAPLYQAVLNLVGDQVDDNSTVLVGEHLTSDIQVGDRRNTGGSGLAIYHYHFYTMLLSYHFNDFKKAKEMVKMLPSDMWVSGVAFFVPFRILYTGLVYTALCRSTDCHRRLMYRRRATVAMNQLRTWAKKGAVNCKYMHHLLQAELLASSGRNVDLAVVLKLYDTAIGEVKELEILHHIALANELAGIFVKEREVAPALASTYFMEASRYYEQWGSPAKVQDVHNRHGDSIILLPMMDTSCLTKEAKMDSTVSVTTRDLDDY